MVEATKADDLLHQAEAQVKMIVCERFVGIDIVGRTIKAVHSRYPPDTEHREVVLGEDAVILSFVDGTWTHLVTSSGAVLATVPAYEFTRTLSIKTAPSLRARTKNGCSTSASSTPSA